jgi:iron complex outermembrane receptor protein
VIDAAASRAFGAVDTAGLLQDSIAASGQQIDGSFNSASGGSNAAERPPEGGPGSASISLRGLDAERTLVLLNGRRLAPAGAGGAPTRPDVNMLPSSMIERVEILTGGASAIYGADAVAGVVNLITRRNFEGLEIQAYRSQPEQSGGEIAQINFIVGTSNDRGSVTFAAEFYERNRIAIGDRDYASCARRRLEMYEGTGVLTDPDGAGPLRAGDDFATAGDQIGIASFCRSGFFDNAVFVVDSGVIGFYDPSGTLPTDNPLTLLGTDWTRSPFGIPTGVAATSNILWVYDDNPIRMATGLPQAEFGYYNDNDERLRTDLQSPLRRFAFYSQGEYDLGLDWAGSSPEMYYEMFYSNRQTRSQGTPEQALPIVKGQVPQLNPAGDDFIRDGAGEIVYYDNPLNPFDSDVEGILILDDDYNQIRRTEVEQIRLGGGIRGDVGPFGYDFFATYDRSLGFLSQRILFEPNVFLGTTGLWLANDGAPGLGTPTCGIDPWRDIDAVFTTNWDMISPFINPLGNCTPLDWFNLSVLNDGEFATDAERDFVHALRINRTVVQQSVFGANFTGELFELPGGSIAYAFGLEHRIDSIETTNDVVVERGLQASEVVQSEGSAGGTTYQNDVYLEVEMPFIADQPFFEELTLNAAVRYTSEKNFGSATTYSLRGLWAPTNWLSFRGSASSAFRAPNLREQFLAQNASGTVGSGTDPCYVPTAARDTTTIPPSYDPLGENRDPDLILACQLSGADPFQLGLDGFSISVPTFTTGSTDLDPETAESYSIGFVIQNRWTDLFDADLAVTYWNTTVEDTVEELTGAGVILGCFFSEAAPFTDPLCSRLTRADSGNPRTDFISSVETSFRNIGAIEADGLDINFRASRDFGGVTVGFNSANAFLLGLTRQTDADDPTTLVIQDGTRQNSEFESRNTLTFAWADFTLGFRSSFIEGTTNNESREQRNPLFRSGTNCALPAFGDGTNVAPTGLRICRDVDYTEDYWTHDVSLNYSNAVWSLTVGVNNVTDEDPPMVSSTLSGGYQERNGVVTGGGYDLYGRTFFANLRRSF